MTGTRNCYSQIRLAVLLVFVGSLVFAATSARAISRNEVLARAQVRVDSPVPYSRTRTYAGYRTDCSGYVSMCWKTGTSWSTRSLHKVSYVIPASQLKPGDALNKYGYHVRLFYGWLDDAKTQYVAYESASVYGKSVIAGVRVHSLAEDLASGYKPIRYRRITDSPASANVLKGGSFDTWTRSWALNADQPVWWSVNAPYGENVAYRRKDTYRTARNSLRFINRSIDPAMVNEIRQERRVVGGADYHVTAYAYSPTRDALTMRLQYLDSYGQSIAESATTGAQSGLVDLSFRKMSLLMQAPTETVLARVTFALAGGGTTIASGTVVAGTRATIDDVSMVRPRVGVSIKRSAGYARNGQRVVLDGLVTPRATVGTTATVWVKKPGTAWVKFAPTKVYDNGSGASWKYSFVVKRTTKRGTYYFKTYVPAIPHWLSGTSKAVSVTLR